MPVSFVRKNCICCLYISCFKFWLISVECNFYSDSLGLVFPILTFYLFMKPNKTEKMEWISKIMAVIAGCIGYNIKPQCLIMLIALFIIQFFSCLKTRKTSSNCDFGGMFYSFTNNNKNKYQPDL